MKRLLSCCFVILAACDDSQAIHEPHPSLERMQEQDRVDPFDRRGMQTPPRNTVAVESTSEDVGADASVPLRIDHDLLVRGRVLFDRHCAVCHGITGDGDGPVAPKMTSKRPPSLVEGTYASMPAGETFDVITRGREWMPALAHELPPDDRWATIAYLEALRVSRHADVASLPADVKRDLEANAEKTP